MGNYKIIYEDEAVMVVDKPSGLLTVATPRKEKLTLCSLLNAYPAHRLDRETSGLVLFTRNRRFQRSLMEEFRRRKIKKSYVAFVQGKLMPRAGRIAKKVQDNPFEPAKYAITRYKLLENRNGFSIAQVMPVTGRTNQIRIHFKQIGHPLVGERRFPFARDFKIKFRRVALHAEGIEFLHPLTGKRMSFHSDLPCDMQEFLKTH